MPEASVPKSTSKVKNLQSSSKHRNCKQRILDEESSLANSAPDGVASTTLIIADYETVLLPDEVTVNSTFFTIFVAVFTTIAIPQNVIYVFFHLLFRDPSILIRLLDLSILDCNAWYILEIYQWIKSKLQIVNKPFHRYFHTYFNVILFHRILYSWLNIRNSLLLIAILVASFPSVFLVRSFVSFVFVAEITESRKKRYDTRTRVGNKKR